LEPWAVAAYILAEDKPAVVGIPDTSVPVEQGPSTLVLVLAPESLAYALAEAHLAGLEPSSTEVVEVAEVGDCRRNDYSTELHC